MSNITYKYCYSTLIIISVEWQYLKPFNSTQNIIIGTEWFYLISFNCTYEWMLFNISKVGDLSWGWPKGSLFNNYHTDV